MKIRVFLIFLLVTISQLSFSQESSPVNVVLNGVLVDSLTSETIPYATLKVVDKENPSITVNAVASDENGKFKITVNKKGDYLLIAQFIGKVSISIPIKIDSQKSIDLGNINMQDDSHTLSEVVVSADKPLVKVDLDKITYSMEDDPEAKTNNVLGMLSKVPLITVDGEENIRLKGSSNFRIYLNGKPSNMITNNPKEILRSMPANTVKDIQVITDPGAKYDAEGVAGIINIITHKQSSMGGYTASLSSRVDNFGGYGAGGYLSLKYGKIGFTGNYNYYNYVRPKGDFNSFREDYTSTTDRYLSQTGVTKSNGNGQYGSGELSYEIDTLNLINVSYNRYQGNGRSKMDWLIEMQDNAYNTQYEYNRYSNTKYVNGGTDLNADYQRTFKKKDQLLTASYKFSYNPNDSRSDNEIDPKIGILPPGAVTNRQYSDANMSEHTFQTDFTTPFGGIHNLEAGVKYIIRLNESTSGYDSLNVSGEWDRVPQINDRFKHEEDIFAAYGGYSAKIKKWGMKAGLRYEATSLDVRFPLYPDNNFKVDYSNFVPSATTTYQINPSQNIRFGYNMRILRPGIWQLNPFRDTSNPNVTQQGNPELKAVESHSISTNYSFFNPSLNFNVNLDYRFENNAIEQTMDIIGNGVSLSTYSNIGKRKNIMLSSYVNWSPTKKLRVYSNLNGGYIDIDAGDKGSNNGFNLGVYGGGQYSLPKDFKCGVNIGYFGPDIILLGKSPSFFFHSLNVGKSFMQDKLNFRAYASNPFKKNMYLKNIENTSTFSSHSVQQIPQQQFGLSVSFRFGEMKAQIKKAQRSISNDDVMSTGGSQGGNQGGGQ